MKKCLLSLTLVWGLSAVAGQTWFMSKSNGSTTVNLPYTDPSYWMDANNVVATDASIFSTENDFVIDAKHDMRVSMMALVANSLTIGNLGKSGDSAVGTFQPNACNLDFSSLPGGLILAAGAWHPNHYVKSSTNIDRIVTYTIGGPTRVTAPTAAPFELRTHQYGFKRNIFTDAFQGDSANGVLLTTYPSKDPKYRLGYLTYGFRDLSQYEGSIVVADGKAPERGDWTIGIELGTTTLPGSLTVTGQCAAVGFVDGTNQARVASLELGSRARFVLKSDGQTNGCVTVTGTYVQSGTVVVEPWITGTFPPGRHPFLRLPASATVDASEFVVSNRYRTATLQRLAEIDPKLFETSVVVDEDADSGEKVVCLLMAGTACQTSSDHDNWTTKKPTFASSMTNETHWSDGRADHTNVVCMQNGHCLRTPYQTKAFTFPGRHLVADGVSETPRLVLSVPTFYIDYLYMLAPSVEVCVSNGTGKGNPKIVGESLYIDETTTVNIYNYTSTCILFDMEVLGAGTVKTHGNSSTGSQEYYLEFGGLNTNWQGSVWMQSNRGAYYPNFDKGYPNLYLTDGRNLGGALPAFKYDALRLCHYARLLPRNDVTLPAGLNRGVCVDGAAVYGSENDLTINQPLTVGGSIYKIGAGTLTLGDRAQFLAYEPVTPETATTNTWRLYSFNGSNETVRTYASVAVSEMPDAHYPDLSFLAVSNGHLKVAHADAVNGLTVDFTPMSKMKPGLKLAFNPADDDLRLYGVRNVKTDTPFVGAVNVTFDVTNSVARDVSIFTNGIFTVKSSQYDAVRAQFNVTPPKVKGYRAKPVTFVTGENTTFGYEYETSGMTLLIH